MEFKHTFKNDEVLGDGKKCNLGRSCEHAQKWLCDILKCKSFSTKENKQSKWPFKFRK